MIFGNISWSFISFPGNYRDANKVMIHQKSQGVVKCHEKWSSWMSHFWWLHVLGDILQDRHQMFYDLWWFLATFYDLSCDFLEIIEFDYWVPWKVFHLAEWILEIITITHHFKISRGRTSITFLAALDNGFQVSCSKLATKKNYFHLQHFYSILITFLRGFISINW